MEVPRINGRVIQKVKALCTLGYRRNAEPTTAWPEHCMRKKKIRKQKRANSALVRAH